MPTIPGARQGIRSPARTGLTGNVNVSAPREAAGVALDPSDDPLGQVLQGVAGIVGEVVERRRTTARLAMDSDMRKAVVEEVDRARSLMGGDAENAYEAYEANLRKRYGESYFKGLGDPILKNEAELSLERAIASGAGDVLRHQRDQLTRYQQELTETSLGNTMRKLTGIEPSADGSVDVAVEGPLMEDLINLTKQQIIQQHGARILGTGEGAAMMEGAMSANMATIMFGRVDFALSRQEYELAEAVMEANPGVGDPEERIDRMSAISRARNKTRGADIALGLKDGYAGVVEAAEQYSEDPYLLAEILQFKNAFDSASRRDVERGRADRRWDTSQMLEDAEIDAAAAVRSNPGASFPELMGLVPEVWRRGPRELKYIEDALRGSMSRAGSRRGRTPEELKSLARRVARRLIADHPRQTGAQMAAADKIPDADLQFAVRDVLVEYATDTTTAGKRDAEYRAAREGAIDRALTGDPSFGFTQIEVDVLSDRDERSLVEIAARLSGRFNPGPDLEQLPVDFDLRRARARNLMNSKDYQDLKATPVSEWLESARNLSSEDFSLQAERYLLARQAGPGDRDPRQNVLDLARELASRTAVTDEAGGKKAGGARNENISELSAVIDAYMSDNQGVRIGEEQKGEIIQRWKDSRLSTKRLFSGEVQIWDIQPGDADVLRDTRLTVERVTPAQQDFWLGKVSSLLAGTGADTTEDELAAINEMADMAGYFQALTTIALTPGTHPEVRAEAEFILLSYFPDSAEAR